MVGIALRSSLVPPVLVCGVLALLLAGCPSVDPGSLDPELVRGRAGRLLVASCHFAGEDEGDPMALQERVRRHFEESLVKAYTLFEKGNVLTATKTVINHPGLLQTLEVNRYLSAFVLACAEDRWLTFYRKDGLVRAEPFRDVAERELGTGGRLEISLDRQAFDIHEDVTPQILTFREPAVRIPLDKVELGFQPESSRVTLAIRDEQLIAEVREKVGWREKDDPSLASVETFAEKISLERTLYAVVAGIVLLEDVVRPGAQLVFDKRGASWVFGGFARERDLQWARSVFARKAGRTTERVVLEVRPIDSGSATDPEQ